MMLMSKEQKSSHEYRLQTPSIPALADGLVIARMALNALKIKHKGRKLKDGPLINALVAWYLSQSAEDQARIAREGLERFEALLKGDVLSAVESQDAKGLPGYVSQGSGKPKRTNRPIGKKHD